MLSTNPHDTLFKELLTTFFTEFVELFFKDLYDYTDFSTLEFLDKELVSDPLYAADARIADIVVQVSVRGKKSLFLIHTKVQSTRQAHFSERMFIHYTYLKAKYQKPIYPIALFSHMSKHPEPTGYEEFFPNDPTRLMVRFCYDVVRPLLSSQSPISSPPKTL